MSGRSTRLDVASFKFGPPIAKGKVLAKSNNMSQAKPAANLIADTSTTNNDEALSIC